VKKTYIIDGYNLIHASSELRRASDAFGIDRARADLLNAVAAFAERRSCDCIVVFDGVVGKERISPRVRAVSSRTRSADEVIREQARQHGRKLIVVSSDLEIVGTARTNMAETIPSRAFASELALEFAPTGGSPAPPTDGSARPHRIAELKERSEKPGAVSDDDIDEWKRLFGM